MTDLHLDYLYTAGGNKTNFCHELNRNSNETDNNEASDVTEYGDYNCDSPKLLVDSALQGSHKKHVKKISLHKEKLN